MNAAKASQIENKNFKRTNSRHLDVHKKKETATLDFDEKQSHYSRWMEKDVKTGFNYLPLERDGLDNELDQ